MTYEDKQKFLAVITFALAPFWCVIMYYALGGV